MRARMRSGFALPAAVAALVLLSALVAGVLFIATEELRTGRGDVADQRALATAEWALHRAIADWDARRTITLPVGTPTRLEQAAVGPGDSVEVVVTRVQPRAFWLTARATSALDGRRVPARRVVGASLRLAAPEVPLRAALTTVAGVTVIGGTIVGDDSTAAGSDTLGCEEGSGGGVAGVAVPDMSLVCGETCAGAAPDGVTGAPSVAIDASLTPADESAMRDDSLGAGLARRATIVIAGGTLAPRPAIAGAACDTRDPLNWGDPSGAGACADYYPVIHVRGNAVLAAGAVGQGTLLVDGSLLASAGARFVGVVIAATVIVDGPGAELLGATFATGLDAGASRVARGGSIRASHCAVHRAELGAARVAPVPGRWWAELR